MSYVHGLSCIGIPHAIWGGCSLNRGPHCRKETLSRLDVILGFVCAYVEGRMSLRVGGG